MFISFFKNQDPLRLGLILLLLVIIRLPVFLFGMPLLIPELLWQITGVKLSEGFVMYRDLLESLDPLSAGTYFVFTKFFGGSQFLYHILSLVLVFIQALLFNFILNVNNLYPERTNLPALIYVVSSSLFIDFYTFSPILLGTTFLLIALHFILVIIKSGDNDEYIFYTGVLISIATLFYLPLFLFLLLAILSYLLFTPAGLRKHFLLLTGFILPLLIAGTYYFLKDGLNEFQQCINYGFNYDITLLVSLKSLLFMMALPTIFLLMSLVFISGQTRLINYQQIGVRIFIFWVLISIFSLYFSRRFSGLQLYTMVPALAFFLSHFYIIVKNKYFREISFLVFAVTILWTNYTFLYGFSKGNISSSYEKLVAKEVANVPVDLKNRKIVVLGEDLNYYYNARLATPYLNWNLSSGDFKDLNNYKKLSLIYERFVKDLPDIIIDQKNIFPAISDKIPYFQKEYSRVAGTKNIYQRRPLALADLLNSR